MQLVANDAAQILRGPRVAITLHLNGGQGEFAVQGTGRLLGLGCGTSNE
jgi:hypothetical protein